MTARISSARLDNGGETRPGLGKTFVDNRQQRAWRERLAQAARRTEFERHPQEIGRN